MEYAQLYWMNVAWGLAVLASWVGWGTLVAGAVNLRRGVPLDWGLRAAWGMGLTLAVGGFLLLFRVATGPILQIMVLGGACFWGYGLYQGIRSRPKSPERGPTGARNRKRPKLQRRTSAWPWHVPIALVATLTFLASIQTVRLNWWDDYPAYLPFVHKILANGTLVEPFSWRRLSTYGGQQLLQAQGISVGTDLSMFMIDQGLSLLVLWGLIAGLFVRRKKQLWMLLIVGFLAVWVDVPRINSQSQMSGAVMFLAIYRTLRLQRLGDPQSKHVPWILGMLAGGATTLRMNFLPVAGLMLALAGMADMVADAQRWKTYALRTALAIAAMGVMLVPWAIVLYQSSQTLYYPLMLGHQRPQYAALLSASGSIPEKLQWIAGFLGHGSVLLLLLPLVLVLRRRYRRNILPFYVASVAGAAALAWALTTSDYKNLYRYAFPFLFPSALAAFSLALQHWRFRIQAVAGAVLTAVMLAVNMDQGVMARIQELELVRAGQWMGLSMTTETTYQAYQAAQQLTPPGAHVLCFLSQPALLDYGRNDILTADYASLAAPDPGMPLSEGPEAFRQYLKAQGIDYLIACDFDEAPGLYDRRHYETVRDHPDQVAGLLRIESAIAPFHLAALDLVDALARTPRLKNPGQPVRVIQINP